MLPSELQIEINNLKEKFKQKGYELNDVKYKKIEYDFWDLFYSRTPSKQKNEDKIDYWDPDNHKNLV
jgi:hypothetical protein